jgi:hypothetical protein
MLPSVRSRQQRLAGHQSVQRVINENESSINKDGTVSPAQHSNELHYFNKNMLLCTIFYMYSREEFPTAKRINCRTAEVKKTSTQIHIFLWNR